MVVEKACFEVGIKLGAIFHQFVGLPISPENVEIVERAIESCVKLQPYVVSVNVKIDDEKLRRSLSSFGYTSLLPEMIKAEVVVEVEGSRVKGFLRWRDDLNSPLMGFEVLEVTSEKV